MTKLTANPLERVQGSIQRPIEQKVPGNVPQKLTQKLLLVEDDPALQFTILTALETQGYEVDAVSTTSEAIQRLEDYTYPIVVSDIYIDERT